MTFLNPLVLFGLLAAAIPILLHLLNLRKLRTIEFSTLAFLKELQKTKIRRLKLRQLLLLILRTLLVILIVLAFARPTLRGTLVGSLGSHAKTSAVFIIDDSYSMTVTDEQGDILRQAKQAAQNTLTLFKDGDEIFLIRLSSISGTIPGNEKAVRDFGLLKQEIEEVKPTAVRGSVEDGLRIASRLLAGTQNFNKEVFVFSDFQKGVLRNDVTDQGIKENLFSPEVRFFFVPSGKRGLQNLGVESVTIPSSIFERDKPFTVQARIGNYTGNDIQDHVVSVFLNGTRVAERSVDLPKQASTPVEFSVTPTTVGYVEGFVELEDDDFQYDNRRYFVLQIPEHIRALLVGTARDLQYPRLALSTRTSTTESALVLDEVAPDRLSSVDIKRADAIVLCTSEGFSPPQTSELASFVKSGGGLALFPGTQIHVNSFNAHFASILNSPLVAGIDRPSGNSTESESFVEFDKVELRHPLFEGMFAAQDDQSTKHPPASGAAAVRRLESPRIRTSALFSLTTQSNPIIMMTNGAPFLAEHRIGAGRLLLFAVPPSTDWSDFPLKGLFVPLLHRSVLYLARQQARADEALPGSEVVIRSSAVTTSSWTIRNPEKVDVTAIPTVQAFQQLLRFHGTDELGIYTVYAKEVLIQKFAINLDPRESQTQKATSAEIGALLQRLGIAGRAVRDAIRPETLDRTVLESRFGVELWKYLLVVALIVAVIELLVSRSSKQETLPVP
jgi:hypothetical protein